MEALLAFAAMIPCSPGRSFAFLNPLTVAACFLITVVPLLRSQTVAPPVFLPVEGTSLAVFPVVVTSPTAGAVIRYTVTGAEPTIFDEPVDSGSTLAIIRNMTL